jgi:hypothetical protein
MTFTGWCYFGYWQDGELLYGKPGLSNWASWPESRKQSSTDERKAKREAWRKACENAAVTAQEATSALQEHVGYQIPTLDTATFVGGSR